MHHPDSIRTVATLDAQTPVDVQEKRRQAPQAPAVRRAAKRLSRSDRPLASLWRVREYLRPYYSQILVMLVAALLGSGTEIVIPLLTKAAIDGPIAAASTAGQHGYGLLVPIGLAAIGLGIAEVALNLLRRYAQARAVAGLEQSLRDDIYQHLQRLEPA